MAREDVPVAFLRHATSKVREQDDPDSIATLGFRGEALASIAAVSQVELRTRQAEDEVGTLTTVNGGEFVSQTLAACPVGSQFYVRNLFYNVPAAVSSSKRVRLPRGRSSPSFSGSRSAIRRWGSNC